MTEPSYEVRVATQFALCVTFGDEATPKYCRPSNVNSGLDLWSYSPKSKGFTTAMDEATLAAKVAQGTHGLGVFAASVQEVIKKLLSLAGQWEDEYNPLRDAGIHVSHVQPNFLPVLLMFWGMNHSHAAYTVFGTAVAAGRHPMSVFLVNSLYVVANLTVKSLVCPNRSVGTAVVVCFDNMLRQKLPPRVYDMVKANDIYREGITYGELGAVFRSIMSRCDVRMFCQ